MDQNYITLLDTRKPLMPVGKLNHHKECVNAISWAPNSNSYICSVGDDKMSLIWNLEDMK